MKVIWPDKFKIRAAKIGEDKWKLNYIERYEQIPQEIKNDTVKMLRNAFKIFGGSNKLRVLKDGISVSMEGSREEIYKFIVGEFLPESTMGKKTFGELFISLGALAGLMKPDPTLVKELEQVIGVVKSSLPAPGITGEQIGEGHYEPK